MKPTNKNAKTEAPKREIDWQTMFDRSPYLTTKDDIDLEALERFVIASVFPTYDGDPNDIFDPSNITVSSDEEAALNAAGLITVVLGGIEKGCDMNTLLRGVLGIRKIRKKGFDPQSVPPGSTAWNIVEQRVRGEISYENTIKQLEDRFHISRATAERAIKIIRVRIEHPIDSLNSQNRITFR